MKRLIVALLATGVCFAGSAAEDTSLAVVKEKIAKALSISKDDVRASPVAGWYEVQHGHEFGYVTADGKYLLQGDLVNLQTGERVTEDRRRADRLAALSELGDQNMIEFAPTPPIATKYTVTVFTDVDCGYCRKLHSQMADYNAQGIAIRYVFWPRSGPDTDSWYRAEAVWCSADRGSALTSAKLGKTIPGTRKCDNPVAREYQLGIDFGIRGTPMLVLPNGDLYPGYLPPKALAAELASLDPAKKVALGADTKS